MFDPCGPLPSGTSVLEASAGTGKTHTIGSLVTRYVAEGVASLDDLLIITFGRAASQELRERVRGALLEAERAFVAGASGDEVLAMLLDVNEAERTERLGRLRQALVNFDAATIATTHQFCELVLRSLGVAGDSDTAARFVESLDDLVIDVVDDLYLQLYANADTAPPFDRTAAMALARTVVEDPQAVIADADPDHPVGSARVNFARGVRAELNRRKRRAGLVSYDDLLSQVADALTEDDSLARMRMRQRWSIVLVDEFQDTDPVQWQVLDRAFTGHATMVLIGDPKQAIYAFRGGDVATYLSAAETATERHTLTTNHRSDEPLVKQLETVFRGAQLGDPRITASQVDAHLVGSRLDAAPRAAAVRIRQVRRSGFTLTRGGEIKIGDAREFIARDCAGDIAALLDSDATWGGEPISAGQIAVIVGVRDHGLLIQRELAEVGVPAVVAGGGDVFRTAAADEWLVLLKAMEAPQRSPLVRAAALGPFFGVGVLELDQGEAVTARVADTLRAWAALVRSRGLAAVIEAADAAGLGARVLSRPDGERLITDLRHLGQSLHEIGTQRRLGLSALIGWFRDERTDAARAERPRRLESDAAAVQIVTIHGSKGLQYPVTYVPFAFQRRWGDEVDIALFHDDDGERTVDVAQAGKDWRDHAARHAAEDDGEELRKLYVAMTRAQSQLVVWWAPTTVTARGALHRLLFGRQPGSPEVPAQMPVRDDDYATSVLTAIQTLGGPVREDAVIALRRVAQAAPPAAALAIRTFDRTLDLGWRRTSYSGLIRAAESAPSVGSEPAIIELSDEPIEVEPDATVDPEDLAPIGRLPKGATFGSLVHAVLEHTDPEAEDLVAELTDHAAEQLRWWPVNALADEIAQALAPVYDTSLGSVGEGLTLRQVQRHDRLCELDFEFPLTGGDRPLTGAETRLRDLAPILRRHLGPDDPLRAYAEVLEGPELGSQPLRGYLSGSIDVVLRLPSGRFVIADYKTNVLGLGLPQDYRTELLAEAMLHSHYPLQAILYAVVLHRYLSWRLPSYDPERHLGGVLYLYLRGMTGADSTGGVFSWTPPAALVIALSEGLGGRNA